MKLFNLFLSITTAAVLSCSFVACEKEEGTVDVAPSLETVTDDEIVEDFQNEIFKDVEEAADFQFSSKKSNGETFQNCATISRTISSGERIIVIDFGEQGCTGRRQHVKTGKVIVTVTGTRRTNDLTKVVEFEDFFIDNHKIEGTRTVTTTIEGNALKRNIVIEDGKVTFPNGTVISHEANKTRTWAEGIDTPYDWSDDVWETTGSSSGVNYQQKAYTMTIVTPIRFLATCRFAVSGEKSYEVGDYTGSINFGNGQCDKKANVTVNGVSKEIELGRRWAEQSEE